MTHRLIGSDEENSLNEKIVQPLKHLMSSMARPLRSEAVFAQCVLAPHKLFGEDVVA